MIKLIMFDFDGTISDARKLSYDSLVEVLDRYGYDYDKKKAKKLMGIKMKEIFLGLGIPIRKIENIRKDFYVLMNKNAKKSIKLCVSVKPLRDLKKSKKYKFIVVSNSHSSFIKNSAKILGVNKLFDRIIGAESFTTKDKMLKKLFKEYGVGARECIYIGDRFSDVEYARKAGCIAIAIYNSKSWSSKKELLGERPDFIISDFYGLKKVLKEIGSLSSSV